jgi:hypothetical protein
VSKGRYLDKAPFDGPEHRKKRGPNGRPICRWCGEEVPKGRRSWCSDACVQEFTIRRSSSTLRFHVERRDGGVCAECGLDTDRVERIFRQLRGGYRGHSRMWMARSWRTQREQISGYGLNVADNVRRHWRARWKAWQDRLIEAGWDHETRNGTKSLWQADHIEAVIEGGGGCGLDNIQTLCVPCHKKDTAALAAKRAEKRQRRKKREKQLEADQLGLNWEARCDGCGEMRPASELVRLKGSTLLHCAGCDEEAA